MDINNQITKDQVKEIMRSSKRGCDIAKAVKAYFDANFKRQVAPVVVEVQKSPDQLYEFAKQLFSPVDNPGASVGVGQVPMLVPGR